MFAHNGRYESGCGFVGEINRPPGQLFLHDQKFNRGCRQNDYNQDLDEQNGGHPVEEVPMLGLVAEKVHARD